MVLIRQTGFAYQWKRWEIKDAGQVKESVESQST